MAPGICPLAPRMSHPDYHRGYIIPNLRAMQTTSKSPPVYKGKTIFLNKLSMKRGPVAFVDMEIITGKFFRQVA